MKKLLPLLCCAVLYGFVPVNAYAQNQNLQYSFDLTRSLSPELDRPEKNYHTSMKPFALADSTLRHYTDSVLTIGSNARPRNWVTRKLLYEHLVDIQKINYHFYADYLPDVQIGRDFKSSKTTWVNTRGFQFGLDIGSKFSFYTNFFENQAVFAPYIRDFIGVYRVVPGQSIKDYNPQANTTDYSYSTAVMTYSPIKQLNISLAYDKNFIGDGYRSLFLSDVSSNYSSFKLTGKLGNVQYTSMWSYMIDPLAPKSAEARGIASQYKWGVFQYLDWNISKRLSIGLFQSVLWAAQNADGTHRGFDFRYASPVIFIRPLESSDPVSPDKTHLGVSGKYKLLNNVTLYGQFLLDDFKAKEFFSGSGYWGNKWAGQIGFKTFNTFKVEHLQSLFEFNSAQPYTYSHFQEITSYSNQAQPLAHPFGANFKEVLSIWNYNYKRFNFRLQGLTASYGLDIDGLDYGKNIFAPYDQHIQEYGNFNGQGLHTRLYYADAKVGFMLNPLYNLRIEVGGTLRRETNLQYTHDTAQIMIGLRSTFRNIYYDF